MSKCKAATHSLRVSMECKSASIASVVLGVQPSLRSNDRRVRSFSSVTYAG